MCETTALRFALVCKGHPTLCVPGHQKSATPSLTTALVCLSLSITTNNLNNNYSSYNDNANSESDSDMNMMTTMVMIIIIMMIALIGPGSVDSMKTHAW